jgi:PleD family two-component response regulator
MALHAIESREAQTQLLESLQDKVELRTIKLEQANKKLHEMATHDPLTGLLNRLTLEEDI